jgi:hypothetical protein
MFVVDDGTPSKDAVLAFAFWALHGKGFATMASGDPVGGWKNRPVKAAYSSVKSQNGESERRPSLFTTPLALLLGGGQLEPGQGQGGCSRHMTR